MASLSFEQERLTFQQHYAAHYQIFHDAEIQFRTLIASLLAQVGDFAEVPKVISRVKGEAECIAKFQRKYQTLLEKQQTPYEIKDYITDLIGIRVTCLYESEISEAARVLNENFRSLGVTDKIAKLESTDDAFGYRGLHLDLAINDARGELPEYGKYRDLHFEVQIRTIIQDGWSILDHKMKYKRAIPTALKRRINVLAALFELADHEFLAIRDATRSFEQLAREQMAADAARVATGVDAAITQDAVEPFLNVFQFLEIVTTHFRYYKFWPDKADAFVQEMLRWKPSLTARNFSELLEAQLPIVSQYSEYNRVQRSFYLNPFTQMRHALYLSDTTAFRWMLYEVQRHAFATWLQSNRQPSRQPTTSSEADRADELTQASLVQHSCGRYGDGVVLAERAIAFDPILSGAWRSLAMNLTQLGQHERAREAWRTVDHLTSNGPVDYAEAGAAALQNVRNDVSSSIAWEHLAAVLEREGRGREAITEASAMLHAFPKIHENLVPLVESLVSQYPSEMGALLANMRAHAPNEAHYAHLYGVALRKAGDNGAAIPHLRAAVEAIPSNSNYWYGLGRALEDAGDVAAAIDAFHNAVGCQPTPHRKAQERLSLLTNESS